MAVDEFLAARNDERIVAAAEMFAGLRLRLEQDEAKVAAGRWKNY